jgi:hypothetical protein
MQRTEEEARAGAVVGDADSSCRCGTGEVPLHGAQSLPRRRILGLAVERDADFGGACVLVHVHGDDDREDAAEERDELAREVAENDARILVAAGRVEIANALRQLDLAAAHCVGEELLFRAGVPEHGSGRHLQLAGDVGERRGFESLAREHTPGDVEELLPLNRRRPAHL